MCSFEADEKHHHQELLPWISWVFFFINIPAYRLQNFFFGEAEAPFLHQFKTLQLFLFMEEDSSWSTHRLAFYPSQSLQMFKLDSLGIL